MNRRSFITSLLAGVVAPMILPGAGRYWKRSTDIYVPNPDYIDAKYFEFRVSKWHGPFIYHQTVIPIPELPLPEEIIAYFPPRTFAP